MAGSHQGGRGQTHMVKFSSRKQRLRSRPAQSCTPMMPKMKKTKKQSRRTFPSMGSVSRSRFTRIRIPVGGETVRLGSRGPQRRKGEQAQRNSERGPGRRGGDTWAGAPNCSQPAQWPLNRHSLWCWPFHPEATEMALGPTALTPDS